MRISGAILLKAIVIVVVMALAGCGSSKSSPSSTSSSTKPSSTTTSPKATTSTPAPTGASTPAAGATAWLSALGNRNPTAVCSHFTPAAQQALAAKVGMSCQAYFSNGFAKVANNAQAQQQLNGAKNAQILSVTSNGVRAGVRYTFAGLPQPAFLGLVNTNGQWLVNQFAPTPAG